MQFIAATPTPRIDPFRDGTIIKNIDPRSDLKLALEAFLDNHLEHVQILSWIADRSALPVPGPDESTGSSRAKDPLWCLFNSKSGSGIGIVGGVVTSSESLLSDRIYLKYKIPDSYEFGGECLLEEVSSTIQSFLLWQTATKMTLPELASEFVPLTDKLVKIAESYPFPEGELVAYRPWKLPGMQKLAMMHEFIQYLSSVEEDIAEKSEEAPLRSDRRRLFNMQARILSDRAPDALRALWDSDRVRARGIMQELGEELVLHSFNNIEPSTMLQRIGQNLIRAPLGFTVGQIIKFRAEPEGFLRLCDETPEDEKLLIHIYLGLRVAGVKFDRMNRESHFPNLTTARLGQ